MRILTAVFCFFSTALFSQEEAIQQALQYLVLNHQQETVNTEEISEILRTYYYAPLNINAALKEEIAQLPLLTNEQAQLIINYRTENGLFSSVYELKHLSFSLEFIEMLKVFVKVESVVNNKANYFWMNRFQLNQENQYKMYSRFKYFDPFYSFGFTAEKDYTEKFFTTKQPYGFDFYSGFLQFKRKKTTVLIGDYSVNSGQGLLHSNGYRNTFVYSPYYSNLHQNQTKPYTSSDENSFFRGICLQQQMKSFFIRPFVSIKKLDADVDSLRIKAFPNTGYHGSASELQNKDKAHELAAGNSLWYQNNALSVSLNTLFFQYNLPYAPDSTYYKVQAPMKGQLLNSIDYSLDVKNATFFGEIATDKLIHISLLNGFNVSLSEVLSVAIRYRQYDRSYVNSYASSFAQNSSLNNENGVDVKMLYDFNALHSSLLSFDFFKHPHLQYGLKQPTYGKEIFLQHQYTPHKKTSFQLRYKFKEIEGLQNSHQLRFHCSWNYDLQSSLSFRNEWHWNNNDNAQMAYVSISHQIKNTPFKIYLNYSLFNVVNYDLAIYAYEADLLYSFNSSVYYHKGNRFYAMLKFHLNEYWSFWIKASASFFEKQETNKELKIQAIGKF